LSGAATSYINISIGRVSGDASISVAGGGGQWATDSSSGDLVIRTETTSTKLLFTNGANNATLAVANNNVGIGTTNPTSKLHVSGGNIKVDSGNGIDFSADANASGMTSELLDDYEEGSFTPSIAFGNSDLGVVYSGRTGRYTKIGNRVFFNILLNISNKGTATGIATIAGLPFTAGAGLQGYSAAVGADIGGIIFDNIITYRIVGGSTSITIIENGGNGLTEADFTNTAQQIVSGHYYVD